MNLFSYEPQSLLMRAILPPWKRWNRYECNRRPSQQLVPVKLYSQNVMEPLPDSQDERAAIVDAFIKRRKTVQGAWEALGLTSTTSDKRSAKFFENEPNMLQTKVEQLAKSFLADFRGNLDQLHTDLAEKPWFSEKVSTLGQQYGAKIWGHLQNGEIRSSSESQGKPDWDVPNGRE